MSAAWLAVALVVTAPSGRSLLGELESYDRKLSGAESRLQQWQQKISRMRDEIAGIEANLAAAQVRAGEAFDDYRLRVRALDRMPAGARAVMLGGVDSLAGYLETSRVLRWVAEHDRKLLRRHRAEAEQLADLQQQLQQRRSDIETVAANARDERDSIAAARQERLALLTSITEQEDLAQMVARERSYARRELAAMVQRLQPAGRISEHFADNRGRLPWPAVGRIGRRFGESIRDRFGTRTTHNGIEVQASAGSNVHAIAPGQVVFADWLKGYGQAIIIDHGDGYHSVAAHLGRVEVAVGAGVTSGAIIGTVGDTGSQRGTLLYFEIRENGQAVDPAAWLRP